MIVFSYSSIPLAKNIAKKLKAKFSKLEIKHFPDGEIYLRFKENLKNKDIVIVQSLARSPNKEIVELLFSSLTAKELRARKVLAVIPYLAYMRQDKSFRKGECVSARILPKLIESCGVDAVFTLNHNLHRIKSLSKVFSIPVFELSCEKEISNYLKKNFLKIKCKVVSTNSVQTKFSKIDVSEVFSSAIKRYLTQKPIREIDELF